MYSVINIAGEDYKFEYTIEAALYAECVEKLTEFMTEMQAADQEKNIKKMLKGISNVPQTALTLFYAGLMEHHGANGDNRVPNIKAAKNLITQFLKEHSEDQNGNFYSIFQMCVEQMSEDGFFKLIGLNEMTAADSMKKPVTAPQDHKKATAK